MTDGPAEVSAGSDRSTVTTRDRRAHPLSVSYPGIRLESPDNEQSLPTMTERIQKIRIALLYGGRSSEHDISLLSARAVLNHLDPTRYDILPIAIDREGRWHQQDYERLMSAGEQRLAALPVDRGGIAVDLIAHPTGGALLGTDASVDVVLPIMHGPLCEDGSIQGLCELADVAYVGSRVLGSAVCMDKDVAKRLVRAFGVPVVDYLVVRDGQLSSEAARRTLADEIEHKLNFPVFVKPSNMGSSVGVSRVESASELWSAIQTALSYDTKVLIERAVDAREIELAVLAAPDVSDPPEVSVPGEVKAAGGFYSYDRKYLEADGATLHIPAELSPEVAEEARELARRCFCALECEGLARIDLFLERHSGRLLFNESNTMPGFTTISMYAKMWEASGVSYGELLDRLIADAIARHRRRKQLKRTR